MTISDCMTLPKSNGNTLSKQPQNAARSSIQSNSSETFKDSGQKVSKKKKRKKEEGGVKEEEKDLKQYDAAGPLPTSPSSVLQKSSSYHNLSPSDLDSGCSFISLARSTGDIHRQSSNHTSPIGHIRPNQDMQAMQTMHNINANIKICDSLNDEISLVPFTSQGITTRPPKKINNMMKRSSMNMLLCESLPNLNPQSNSNFQKRERKVQVSINADPERSCLVAKSSLAKNIPINVPEVNINFNIKVVAGEVGSVRRIEAHLPSSSSSHMTLPPNRPSKNPSTISKLFTKPNIIPIICLSLLAFVENFGHSMMPPYFTLEVTKNCIPPRFISFYYIIESISSYYFTYYYLVNARKLHPINIIYISLLMQALGFFLFGYATDWKTTLNTDHKFFFQFISILASVLTGNALAGLGFSTSLYIYQLFSNNVSTMNALYEASIGIGGCLGPLFGSFTYGSNGSGTSEEGQENSSRWSFWSTISASSFISMMAMIVIYFGLPRIDYVEVQEEDDQIEHENQENQLVSKSDPKTSTKFFESLSLLKSSGVLITIISLIINCGLKEFFDTLYSNYLTSLNIPEQDIGIYFSIMGFSYAISGLIVGYFSDKQDENQRKRIRILMTVGSLGSAVFIFLTGYGVKFLILSSFSQTEFKLILSLFLILGSILYSLAIIPIYLEMILCAEESGLVNDMRTKETVSALASMAYATAPIFGSGFASHVKQLIEEHLEKSSSQIDARSYVQNITSTTTSVLGNSTSILSSNSCGDLHAAIHREGSYEITAALYGLVLLVLGMFMIFYYFCRK